MDGENDPPRPLVDPVAAWVREGLRDVEIAVRLGVSVGEARERRARLQGEPPPRPQLALPPPPPLEPRPAPLAADAPPVARRGLVLLPALLLAAVALLAGWWVLGAGSEPQPARTVAPFVPAPIAMETAMELHEAPAAPFPADLSLVVREGDRSLERIYIDQRGTQRETLLVAPEGAALGRVVSDVDGLLLVAALISHEATTFVQSTDGGITWAEQGSLHGAWEPIGVWEGETVAWRDSGRGLGEFVRVPSGEVFVPPYPDGALPLAILAHGRLLWRVPGSGVIAEGDRAPYASPSMDQGSYHEWLAPLPTGTGTMIHWRANSPSTGGNEDYVGIMTRRGILTQSWVGLPGAIAGRSDGATVVAVAPHPDRAGEFMAVLVELHANTWRPLLLGGDLLASPDERFIVSVRAGPFARVETAKECAPVRPFPQVDAPTIDCVAPNVILRAPGETRIHLDYNWRQIIAPNGRPGWIDVSDLR